MKQYQLLNATLVYKRIRYDGTCYFDYEGNNGGELLESFDTYEQAMNVFEKFTKKVTATIDAQFLNQNAVIEELRLESVLVNDDDEEIDEPICLEIFRSLEDSTIEVVNVY